MAIYNPPPSSTAQYQLTASYLSSSFSSNTASLFIQSDGTSTQTALMIMPTVETVGGGTKLYISAGSSSAGSNRSGDLYLVTQNAATTGFAGNIYLQPGGSTTAARSGSIYLDAKNIAINTNNNYTGVKFYVGRTLDGSSNMTLAHVLFKSTLITNDANVFEVSGVLSNVQKSFTMSSNIDKKKILPDGDAFLTSNLIFLNATVSSVTCSQLESFKDDGNSEITSIVPNGSSVRLFNSGSNAIFLRHNDTDYLSKKLFLSGSVSRNLSSLQSVEFTFVNPNWYEVYR